MNRQCHEEEVLLGPYVLGVLDDAEAGRVEAHAAGCESCRGEVEALREMETALGEVPPEAFIDGPPHGGDLLLQRTLRQMRVERGGVRRRRQAVTGLVAAAVLAGVFWAGTAVPGGGAPVALPPPVPSVTAPPAPPLPGTRVASATDASSGARMTVRVTPAAGWVRVHAAVTGVPKGERCLLVVVGRDGSRTTAGSWVVGAGARAGEGKGAGLDGSAAVAPADVAAVVVENEAGKRFVTVPVPV
ncbi:zf-HC2 domain-containing protein [Streptomyces sp. WAC01280]|uniref:zf-HC2 domain-containing protein n=1 Tax=Streptomyces sp. WAC01280 TaxID=2487424 RepID=UPI000F7A88B0|nr:zf-HC2 domain-containing protein [Streptomyces sp. WAC01280]RSS58443.1 anti-sigma factor [Streptomyces sp. WAC01280]